ncbi:Hypp2369 [Branchiostoma lanceolatum]|uniref:Hypp2369 protein n=1 Tax=Branchiostoma lanceolatum TaxID=7740 RepID=A0A8J9ZSQ1_BRALA|nr:Hypp2369 [Branchiostoma lanceolatum]
MAGPRMLLLAGVNLLIIFHLCQAQTAPAITTNMVTKAVTIATSGPAAGLITGTTGAATTGATSRATTDAATTAITTNMVTAPETIATTGPGPATGLITGTTGAATTDAATTGATSRATTGAATTGATSRITTGADTTTDRTDTSAADVPTTKNPQTTKEASTKSTSITGTATTTTATATTDVVTSKVTTQTAQEANTDSNDTATTTDAGLYSTDGIFPTGDFSTNSTTTTDGGSTLEQSHIAIIAASIILVFLLCTGCCLFLLSDWSCTQPKQVTREPGCCSCNCFSRQDFGNTSGFSPGKSESHESLEMETTRVTEVSSFTNTSTLHWSTANHHSFHKYMAPQSLDNEECPAPRTTEDPENRGNHFRGVIAMISDDGDATRSKKYSEAINLDIFQRGEDDTGEW